MFLFYVHENLITLIEERGVKLIFLIQMLADWTYVYDIFPIVRQLWWIGLQNIMIKFITDES